MPSSTRTSIVPHSAPSSTDRRRCRSDRDGNVGRRRSHDHTVEGRLAAEPRDRAGSHTGRGQTVPSGRWRSDPVRVATRPVVRRAAGQRKTTRSQGRVDRFFGTVRSAGPEVFRARKRLGVRGWRDRMRRTANRPPTLRGSSRRRSRGTPSSGWDYNTDAESGSGSARHASGPGLRDVTSSTTWVPSKTS